MLNIKHNDTIEEFENNLAVQKMWNRLRITYNGTFILHAVMVNLEIYVMDPKHTIDEHSVRKVHESLFLRHLKHLTR